MDNGSELIAKIAERLAKDGVVDGDIRIVYRAVNNLADKFAPDQYVELGVKLAEPKNVGLLSKIAKGEVDDEAVEALKSMLDTPADNKVLDNESVTDDNDDSEPEDADGETPEEESNTPNIDAMSNTYIADAIRRCFRNDLKEGDRLAKYVDMVINKYDNWKDYIKDTCNGGKNTAVVERKVLPKMVDNFNKKYPNNPIDKSLLSRRVVDDNTVDADGATMVVPDGFNKTPEKLPNSAFSMETGFFTVNYASDLVQTLLHTRDDSQRSHILERILLKAKGTPAAKYLVSGFRKSKNLLDMLTFVAKSTGGTPMVRKVLKVSADGLVGDSELADVKVEPVGSLDSVSKVESVSSWEEPLVEAFWGKKDEDVSSDVTLPRAYLAQFYEVVTPDSEEGIRMYGKLLSREDLSDIKEKLGDAAFDDIKSSNKNIRELLVKAYLRATNGVPPFYVLVGNTKLHERLRVSEETYPGDTVCVKTVSGPNKAFAYMIPEDVADAIFEVG